MCYDIVQITFKKIVKYNIYKHLFSRKILLLNGKHPKHYSLYFIFVNALIFKCLIFQSY